MLMRLFESSRSFWHQHAPAFLDTRARRSERLGLMAVRFEATLVDLPPQSAYVLRMRIQRARGPADLWHLRLDLFNAIAKAHGQHEAQSRLRELDGLFASRGGPTPSPMRRVRHQ
jgi:hypothetical protein